MDAPSLLARSIFCSHNDPDLGDFLVDSGRVPAHEIAQARALAIDTARSLEESLSARGSLSSNDLRMLKRALWLDRCVRALRLAAERGEALPTLDLASKAAAPAGGVALLPFALDVLTRLAVDADASMVGMSINHRLVWTEGPLTAEARRWAAFAASGDRPVVSTVLARSPAAAPQIAALARAGLVRLERPGSPGARLKSKTGTLPPPAPRLSVIPDAPRPARLTQSIHPPQLPRAPRLRLDPGADGLRVETIPPVQLDMAQPRREPFEDPLRDVELRIAALEQRAAPGPERARAFVELARLWQTRLGSLEEAARALREAAAADPGDLHVLQEAALHCSYLGRIDLGVAYAQAAISAGGISVERAAAFRLLADIQRAADDADGCIEALSEAAAEDPSQPEAHELLAHLLAERDNLAVASAHARLAALGWVEHEPKRAAMLYAMAYGWNPADPQLSEEYAALLHTLGQSAAGVAIVAETARNLEDSGARKRVRLTAARRAEASGRRDLSAELLLEVFDDDPGFELIYAPLDQNLAEQGNRAEHAAVLESIASACSEEHKPLWMTRAAEALLGLPGEHDNALRWLASARQLAPGTELVRSALARAGISEEQLDSVAPDAVLRAQQLEASIAHSVDDAQEHALLGELVSLRVQAGDPRAVASAALRLLTLDGKHALAAARLWRASSALRDPALLREALTLRARAQSDELPRGRALCALARHLENTGDFDGAVSSAESALSADSSAADAAIVVLRHAHRLEARRAVTLLARARTILGDSPPLLFGLAQAALAASDVTTHLQVLHELSELLPFVPDARLRALEFHLSRNDAATIVENSEALLRDAGGPLVVARVRDAVERLAELGAHADAANLAQRVLDEQGRSDPAYADHALQLARASADAWLVTQALERSASAHGNSARLARLLDLATHHAQRQDRVGELHALLRALAVDADCRRALDDLRSLFQRAGDTQRLLTVLCLDLDATTDPETRREKLFALVNAAAVGSGGAVSTGDGNRSNAVGYLGALMAESVDDRAWLLKALGALFALGSPEWAIDEAKRLANELPESAGGALYLWLARRAETDLADTKLALSLATEGAKTFPSVGELLLMVERITLASKDAPAASALYEALIAASIGPHGQRALHYRAGRWLERVGALPDALIHYASAFELAKGAGVAYKAIERIARAIGKLTPLVDAQEALAETLRDDDARCLLLQDAARIALNDLDDPARGFRILMRADELGVVGQLGPALLDAVHRLGVRDQGAADTALASLATTWQERAEKYWDAEVKTKLLLDAARVHIDQRHDAAAGVRTLALALVPEVSANLSVEARAATLTSYADALLAADRSSDANDALGQALALVADHAPALALRQRITGSVQAPPLSLVPPDSDVANDIASLMLPPAEPQLEAEVSAESALTPTLAATPEAKLDLDATAPDSRPSEPVLVPTPVPARRPSSFPMHELAPARTDSLTPRGSAEEAALRSRAEQGDLQALAELTARVGAEPSRRSEAHYLLGRLVRAEPFRTESLRQLHHDAQQLSARAEAAVSGQILSLFDPTIAVRAHRPFHVGLVQDDELRTLLDPGTSRGVGQLLAMLWENARAIPRFRRSLEGYEVGPRQRLTPSTDSPLTVAFAQAARLLSRSDVPFYLKPKAQPAFNVVPTHPPAVIARAELADDALLLYRVAQSLFLADPERAVLCVLPEQEGRDLFSGMLGAFGPKEVSARLDRAGKELASVLWHTVPMRPQAQMRALVAAHLAELDYERLRRASMLAAQRAGLVVLGDARLALEAVASLEPALRTLDVHTLEGFRAACQNNEAFAELVRTAISEPYLALVAQVL